MSAASPPRVFISYSHDNRGHSDRVAALSARLREDGIDCRIDQYYVRPPGGWPNWMQQQIDEADTVLVVCTKTYRDRFERRQPSKIGRGVRWESVLIEAQFYRDGALTDQLVPVIFHRDDDENIPNVLYALDHAHVDPDNLDQPNRYDELVRLIERKPRTKMPPLGQMRGDVSFGPPQSMPLLSVHEEFFGSDELAVQIHALPITGPELFGRDEQLQQLDHAWANDHTNVISLVAFGGVGKSALVNHWLAQMAVEDYRGARRVYGWSAYSQGSKDRAAAADLFIDQALRFFGDPDPEAGPIDQRAVRLGNLIRQRPTLLVLDGIESLQYAPGEAEGHIKDVGLRTLVRELAARNSGLCVITTRQTVADLAPYESTTCQTIDLDELKPADGATLLESLDVKGSAAELQTASEEFGGHALALTLLGTLLRDRWTGDVRKRDMIGPLEHEISNGGHARRVMESYEDWLGDGPERTILRMLGLFDRPAKAGAIRALRKDPPIDGLTDRLDDWDTALIRLRHARLVAAAEESDPETLDAHPWVREHFGLKLREENPDAWRAGHDRLFEYYRGEGCEKQFPDTLDEMAPLFAAVTHGCAAGRHQEALKEVYESRIQRGEEYFSIKRLGAFGPELAALSGLFDPPWYATVSDLSDGDQGYVLSVAGFDLRALGRLAEAVEPLKAAFRTTVDQEDWKNAAAAANNLSELQLTLGRIAESIEWAKQCVDFADRSEDAFTRIVMHTALAHALHQAGWLDQAVELFRRAEAMQKDDQPQYPRLYSVFGYRYCDLLLTQGRYEDVRNRAEIALQIVLNGSRRLLDIGLNHLSLARAALMAAQSGRTDAVEQARPHVQSVVDTLRQQGAQEFVSLSLLARAEFYRYTGERDAARRDLDEAMAIATRDPAGHMKLHMTDVHLARAWLDLDNGLTDDARDNIDAAAALIEETGYHRRDGELAELQKAVAP